MFHARPSVAGDEALEEARDGYLPGMSVGFVPVQHRRGRDGVREIVEARLLEVSLVPIPAYEGARVLAVREAAAGVEFAPLDVDLAPILPAWIGARGDAEAGRYGGGYRAPPDHHRRRPSERVLARHWPGFMYPIQ